MQKFIAWFDEKNFLSVRTFMLAAAFWLTIHITDLAAAYAMATKLTDGTQIATVIAAMTVPTTAFTSYVYRKYAESRPKDTTTWRKVGEEKPDASHT